MALSSARRAPIERGWKASHDLSWLRPSRPQKLLRGSLAVAGLRACRWLCESTRMDDARGQSDGDIQQDAGANSLLVGRAKPGSVRRGRRDWIVALASAALDPPSGFSWETSLGLGQTPECLGAPARMLDLVHPAMPVPA